MESIKSTGATDATGLALDHLLAPHLTSKPVLYSAPKLIRPPRDLRPITALSDLLVGPGPGNTVRIDIDQTLAHYFLPASKPLLYLASVNNTLILIRYLWKLATSLLPLTTESKVLQGNI